MAAQHGFGIRPYASGGVGLIRTRVDGGTFFNDLDHQRFRHATSARACTCFFTDSVGIRGDVRYFRSLQDDEPDDEFDIALSDFDFWRATVGITFRFGN